MEGKEKKGASSVLADLSELMQIESRLDSAGKFGERLPSFAEAESCSR